MARTKQTYPRKAIFHSWERLKANNRFTWIAGYLGLLLFVSVCANILANRAPLTCVYQGERLFPIFSPNERREFYDPVDTSMRQMFFRDVDWHVQEFDAVVWAPIPHGAEFIEGAEALPPGARRQYRAADGRMVKVDRRFRHLLGTSAYNVDMLAGLIYGTRISLLVGVLAAGLAGLIGLLIGASAAYWGNHRLSLKRGTLLVGGIGLFCGWFYGFHLRRFVLADAAAISWWRFIPSLTLSCLIFLACMWIFYLLGNRLSRTGWWAHRMPIPIDAIISRLIEWIQSVPVLLLVVAIAAIFKDRSIWLVMTIIGLTAWPGIAILVRGQMMSILPRNYIEAARALGLRNGHILFRHALPNALPSIFVIFSAVVGSAIMAESSLSFLRLVEKAPSWGGLISDAHTIEHLKHWWIGVFPGLMIFLTVLSFNMLAELWRDASDPKFQEAA
ncbi:MAG: ABC transporter permease [Bacteroidota bacterium]